MFWKKLPVVVVKFDVPTPSRKIRQRYPLFEAHRLGNIFEYFELVQSKQVYWISKFFWRHQHKKNGKFSFAHLLCQFLWTDVAWPIHSVHNKVLSLTDKNKLWILGYSRTKQTLKYLKRFVIFRNEKWKGYISELLLSFHDQLYIKKLKSRSLGIKTIIWQIEQIFLQKVEKNLYRDAKMRKLIPINSQTIEIT